MPALVSKRTRRRGRGDGKYSERGALERTSFSPENQIFRTEITLEQEHFVEDDRVRYIPELIKDIRAGAFTAEQLQFALAASQNPTNSLTQSETSAVREALEDAKTKVSY